MPDAKQRLETQRAVITKLQEQLGALQGAEDILNRKPAAALKQTEAIQRAANAITQSAPVRETLSQLSELSSDALLRERNRVKERLDMLDKGIEDVLSEQARTIFENESAHTAAALRVDYLQKGLDNQALLARLTEALFKVTQELNRSSGLTDAKAHAQAQRRWRVVYDACNGKQAEIVALRKKAAAFLPFWRRLPLLWLVGGAALGLGILAIVLIVLLSITGGKSPSISSIEPSSTIEGSEALTLTIKGVNFDNATVLQWRDEENGLTIITPTLRTSDQLTTTVAASRLQKAGNVFIRLHNAGANRFSNEMTFVIEARTPTPTPTVTRTPTPTPTDTSTPTFTPTPTPTPVVGDLACTLRLTGKETATISLDTMTVGEAKEIPVQWLLGVNAAEQNDCGETDVAEITRRSYRLTPQDEKDWIISRQQEDVRLTPKQRAQVELTQRWLLKAQSTNVKEGQLTFGLQYKISDTEWKEVLGDNGQPLQLVLSWGQIAVRTATSTPTPTSTRTPTPARSYLNGAITLREPADGQTLVAGTSITMKWTSTTPSLNGKQVFVVKYRHNTKEETCWPAKNTQCTIVLSETGDYTWQVWIEDGAGNRISDQSPIWAFKVQDRSTPPVTNTPTRGTTKTLTPKPVTPTDTPVTPTDTPVTPTDTTGTPTDTLVTPTDTPGTPVPIAAPRPLTVSRTTFDGSKSFFAELRFRLSKVVGATYDGPHKLVMNNHFESHARLVQVQESEGPIASCRVETWRESIGEDSRKRCLKQQ